MEKKNRFYCNKEVVKEATQDKEGTIHIILKEPIKINVFDQMFKEEKEEK